MNREELELQEEDEEFTEIEAEEDSELLEEAELLDEDEEEDEDTPGVATVDPDDLTSGFDVSIPIPEVDVDEDVEYDEAAEIDDEEPMTEAEVSSPGTNRAPSDEVELALDDVWATGKTVAPGAFEE